MSRLSSWSMLVLLGSAGCEGPVEWTAALEEPLRVTNAWFVPGDLPVDDAGGAVTSIDAANGILIQGQRNRVLTGRVTADAYSVAIRLGDTSSGWWVLPVADANPLFPGERDFLLRYDVGFDIPLGGNTLQLASVGEDGARGLPFELSVCVNEELVPRGLHACDPTIPPPAAIIAIEWDRNVDLDLVVRTPSNDVISWKSPRGGEVDGSARLTRDSNAACVTDGRNGESLVWDNPPPPGNYLVYADLFEACGSESVLFTITDYVRQDNLDGTFTLIERTRSSGGLLDVQATGGAKQPLYVTTIAFP